MVCMAWRSRSSLIMLASLCAFLACEQRRTGPRLQMPKSNTPSPAEARQALVQLTRTTKDPLLSARLNEVLNGAIVVDSDNAFFLAGFRCHLVEKRFSIRFTLGNISREYYGDFGFVPKVGWRAIITGWDEATRHRKQD
jgi:hypothetical protein